MANVKVLSDESLKNNGFTEEEVASAAGNADGYVGEKNGIKYFRAQNEINIDHGDFKTREVRLPGQFGDKEE